MRVPPRKRFRHGQRINASIVYRARSSGWKKKKTHNTERSQFVAFYDAIRGPEIISEIRLRANNAPTKIQSRLQLKMEHLPDTFGRTWWKVAWKWYTRNISAPATPGLARCNRFIDTSAKQTHLLASFESCPLTFFASKNSLYIILIQSKLFANAFVTHISSFNLQWTLPTDTRNSTNETGSRRIVATRGFRRRKRLAGVHSRGGVSQKDFVGSRVL